MAGIWRRLQKQGRSHQKQKNTDKLDQSRLPTHVAVIMDGNGRWAKKRGLPRLAGHKAGADSIRDIVEFSGEIGIPYLTLYAFSTENWSRPKDEVEGLMDLLLEYLHKETEELHKNGVKIQFLGDRTVLNQAIQKEMERAEKLTGDNKRLQLNIAVNYGGRAEITRAVKKIAEQVQNKEIVDLEEISEEKIASCLYTAGIPDPDLLIRPSGENRLSNFLLWQAAYTELWVSKVLWPDFRRDHLTEAILAFQKRDRRFGAVEETGGEKNAEG